jgi:hypothetical protein
VGVDGSVVEEDVAAAAEHLGELVNARDGERDAKGIGDSGPGGEGVSSRYEDACSG